MTETLFSEVKNLIPADEASRLAACTRDHIARLCREGSLEGKNVGIEWCVEAGSLDRYLKKERVAIVVDGRRYVSPEEVAAMVGYGNDYILQLCREGRLAALRVDGAWRIEECSFHAFYLAQQEAKLVHSGHLRKTGRNDPRFHESVHKSLSTSAVLDHSRTTKKDISSQWRSRMLATLLLVAAFVMGGYSIAEADQGVVAIGGSPACSASTYACTASECHIQCVDTQVSTNHAVLHTIASAFDAVTKRIENALAFSIDSSAGSLIASAGSAQVTVGNAFSPLWDFIRSFLPENAMPMLATPTATATPVHVVAAGTASLASVPAHAAPKASVVSSPFSPPVVPVKNPQQPIVRNIVQTTIQNLTTGVTPAYLTLALDELDRKLTSQIGSIVAGSAPVTQMIAQSQRIDQLSGTVLNNVTVHGISGLAASDIPSLPYLAAAGLIAVTNGGTGTSTIPAYGRLLIGNSAGGYDLVATSSLGISGSGGATWGSIAGTLANQTDVQAALNAKLSSVAWYATTTDGLAQGVTNLYFTTPRATANFISNLAATSSVASITTLSNLSLPYSQLTGTPSIAAYPFGLAGNATSTLIGFNGGLAAFASSTIGNGNQNSGLTINGGATTTGNAYFAGNVGIGTTTPIAALDVSSTDTTNGQLRLENNGFYTALIQKNSGDFNIAPNAAGNIYLGNYNGSSNFFRIVNTTGAFNQNSTGNSSFTGTGNLGVGTTSPYAKLSVVGTVVASNFVATSTATSTFAGAIQSTCFSTDGVTCLTSSGGGAAYPFALAGNATSTLTQFNGGLTAFASSTIGNGNQNSGLTINGGATTTGNAYFAGNVGIGATNQVSKLDFGTSVANVGQIISLYTSGNIRSGIGMDAATAGLRIYSSDALVSANSVLSVGTIAAADGATFAELFRVQRNGNIGIGTTSPSSILSIGNTNGINFSTATSTFSSTGGINLASGCFAINGTCVSGGGVGTNYWTLSGGNIYNNTGTNVGIGATSPTNPLQVLSGSANTAGDSLTVATAQVTGPNWPLDGAGSNATFLVSTNDAAAVNVGGSIGFAGRYTGTSQATWADIKGAKEDNTAGNYGGYLAFGTRAIGTQISEKLRITGTGILGIGTTTPGGFIDLYGNPAGGIYLNMETSIAGRSNWAIKREDVHGSELNFVYSSTANGTPNTSALYLSGAGTGSSGAGNVGIGDTAPATPLAVKGAGAFYDGGVVPDNGYNGDVRITRPVASGQYINLVRVGTYGWSIGTVYNTSTFAIGQVAATDSNFTAPAFNITTGGSVGIGTTNPGALLTVNGTASSTNLIISSAGGTAGCATFDTIGTLSNTHVACGSGGSSFAYPFGLAGNATSTLTQFNAGLTAFASSTIGNGLQAGGLTINGGATTTGFINTPSLTGGYQIDNSTILTSTLSVNNFGAGVNALSLNPTGDNNSAFGNNALGSLTTGTRNTALGSSALTNNVTGSFNTAVGMAALFRNNSATTSVAMGYFAGAGASAYHNQGGTYLGYESGFKVGTGSDYNTFLGYQSGYDVTTGTNNLILGQYTTTGVGITTGSGNILLGNGVDAGLNQTGSNQLNIGNLIFGTGLAASSTLSTGNVGIASSTPWGLLSVNPNGIAGPSFVVGSSTATSFIITNTGNVGIGTTNPGALFTVNGTASSTNLTISGVTGGLLKTSASGVVSLATAGSDYLTSANIFAYPFITTSNFGTTANATSTPVWFKLGLEASSTIQAANINIDQYSSYQQAGQTLLYSSSTVFSTMVGIGAGSSQQYFQAVRNTAVGYQALASNITAQSNTAVGYQALTSSDGANLNTAVGSLALASSTSGQYNTAIGGEALLYNTTGSSNVGIGLDALLFNTTGSNNVAIGKSASLFNLSATSTVAIGNSAAKGTGNYSNQGGTYLGYQSGLSAATGSDYNSFFGYQAGYDVTTGTNNLILGQYTTTGVGITTGSGNILLGNGVDAGLNRTGSNQLNIGNLLFGTGLAASSTLSTGNIGIGTTTPGSLFSIGTTNGINFSTATSTFNSTGGINLAAGCFAIAGNCLSSGATLTGTTGQTLYFNGTNTTVATSSLYMSPSGAVGIGGAPSSLSSSFEVRPAASNWVMESSAANNSWDSVTYGNGLFVAVDSSVAGSNVMTSPDGITWTIRTEPSPQSWNSVTYGNGIFVAVAASNVMTSPDGITWTSRTPAAAIWWQSVTYGNGLFVAVAQTGTGNRVMTSPDGITWTSRTSAADNSWQSVTYGGGLFVAVAVDGSGNRVMTSPDGITWTIRTSAANNSWNSVIYGNGLFVAVASSGTGNRVMTSPDGITWTSRTSAADNSWYSLAYGAGLFVAVAQSGTGNRVMTSSDGITWTSHIDPVDNNWLGVTYGNGLFVAVAQSGTGNRVMISGSTGFTVTQTGNTGVGTSTPWARFGIDTSNLAAGVPSFVVGSSTATNFIVTNAGNVGIGTTSPSAQFAINTPMGSAGALSNLLTIGSTTATGAYSTLFSINSAGRVTIAPAFTASSTIGNTNIPAALEVQGDIVSKGTVWTSQTSAANNNWLSVTYGNGLFVAVGYGGTGNEIMTSPDGINWVTRTSVADNTWSSVTYGNGLFVAVSQNGTNRVMTSPDGITWTARNATAANSWTVVTYGNGLFVAVAQSGTGNRVMTSPDGINWTTRASAANDSWDGLTYGNGLFVAVSYTGTIMTSPDGITWTTRTAAASNNWDAVTYGNGLFVAVAQSGTGNRVMTSPDGITWTARTSAADNSWYSVTYGNGLFVAVSNSGTGNRVMTSPDAITWTARTNSVDNSWQAVTYGNGLFVAVAQSGTGNRVMTSGKTDYIPVSNNNIYQGGLTLNSGNFGVGTTSSYSTFSIFAASTTNPNLTLFNIGSSTGTGVLSSLFNISNTGFMTISPVYTASSTIGNTNIPAALEVQGDIVSKGTVWTSQTSAADNSWVSVTYGNGLFVAVAGVGPVMTSPDGINWTSRTPAVSDGWNSITYGNGLFVVVSAGQEANGVMTSPDGINWIARTPAITSIWSSVTYGNGLFVAVSQSGTGNRVMTSPDGINWTTRTSSADNSWSSVTYGNGLFVAVSGNGTNRVMTSPDGITWTARNVGTASTWNAVTYGNGLFVAVDGGGAIMTSPDGITWTARNTPTTNTLKSVTYGGGLFVAVASTGTGNRVETSPDGINWTTRASSADNSWSSVTYGNGLFVATASSGTGNRVMTSGKTDMISFQNNNIYQGGMQVNGLVGIGTSTPGASIDIYNGALCVDDSSPTCKNAARTAGTIYAVATTITGIDLAERYPTMDATLGAGEIVGFDPANPVFVSRASNPGHFLGVVSTAPGITLGGYNDVLYKNNIKLPIALSGRVPVKVNMDGGAIAVGDAITISSVPGVGAKATTTTQTIGIALEPYSGTGTSTIQVFIKPELTLADQSVTGIEALTDFATGSTTIAEQGFITGFMQSVFARVGAWLASATNGIGDVFAQTFHAQQQICVDDQCLTKDDVRSLLAIAHGQVAAAATSTVVATSTAPVITILGANPAHVAVGTSYNDLGASVTDAKDTNLGVYVSVDGGATTTPGLVSVDTSVAGTHTILYSATNTSGKTTTATRQVIVGNATSTASSTSPQIAATSTSTSVVASTPSLAATTTPASAPSQTPVATSTPVASPATTTPSTPTPAPAALPSVVATSTPSNISGSASSPQAATTTRP